MKNIPQWAKWYCYDSDGYESYFANRPCFTIRGGFWYDEDNGEHSYLGKLSITTNWINSLIPL